jgi:hypothetical protein
MDSTDDINPAPRGRGDWVGEYRHYPPGTYPTDRTQALPVKTGPSLVPMLLAGGLSGLWASGGNWLWLLGGAGTSLLLWASWTLTYGLTQAAARGDRQMGRS